jgi:hypothetical protein
MYEYQEGGFWKHEDRQHPLVFRHITGTELKQERDSASKYFRPIYIYNEEISTLVSGNFRQICSRWTGILNCKI